MHSRHVVFLFHQQNFLWGSFHTKARSISLLSQASRLRLGIGPPRETFRERTLGAWSQPTKSSVSADAFLPKGLEGPQGGGKSVIRAAAE